MQLGLPPCFWRKSLPVVGIITREVPGGTLLLEGHPLTLMETLFQTFTPHHDPPTAHRTACGPMALSSGDRSLWWSLQQQARSPQAHRPKDHRKWVPRKLFTPMTFGEDASPGPSHRMCNGRWLDSAAWDVSQDFKSRIQLTVR